MRLYAITYNNILWRVQFEKYLPLEVKIEFRHNILRKMWLAKLFLVWKRCQNACRKSCGVHCPDLLENHVKTLGWVLGLISKNVCLSLTSGKDNRKFVVGYIQQVCSCYGKQQKRVYFEDLKIVGICTCSYCTRT